MKRLKLDTMLDLTQLSPNVVLYNSLKGFVEDLALELLSNVESEDLELFDFTEDFRTRSETSREIDIALTEDWCLRVKFTATADILREEVSETAVALGVAGEYAGYENLHISIDKVTFYVDFSEIDMTYEPILCEKIQRLITNA